MVSLRARGAWLLASLVGAAACGPLMGPVKVEAMVADEGEGASYRLDTVVLQTVQDVLRGRGAHFDVRGGLDLPIATVFETLAAEELAYEDMVRRGRGQGGVDLQMQLGWDGEKWRAEDYDGLQYLTLFHHFETVWAFFGPLQAQVPLQSAPHPLIAYHGSLALTEALPVPILNSDNAAYVAPSDTWLALRSVLNDEGVPFMMNAGIVAHEFHHRVFFQAMFGGDRFATWRAWMVAEESISRAGKMLKALDEGLADIAAATFRQDAAFMDASLTGVFASHAAFRDLDEEFAANASFDSLDAGAATGQVARHCGLSEPGFGAADFNYYCLGTVVAKTLYEAAGQDFEPLRRTVLPALYRALPSLGEAVHEKSVAQGVLVFEMEMFLDAMAQRVIEVESEAEHSGDVAAGLCEAYARRFTSLYSEEKVPHCFL